MYFSLGSPIYPLYQEIINPAPTTLCLFGTSQFIQASNGSYFGFVTTELHNAAKAVLQRQIFMLYTWCLIRFCLQHKYKAPFLKAEFFNVTPLHFSPSPGEVQLYLRNPKFLWRFSMGNYAYFAMFFNDKHPEPCYRNMLLTYNEDDTPIIPFLKANAPSIINVFKKSSNKYAKKFVPFDVNQIKTIMEKEIKFKMSEYETSEIYYSDDFFIHQLPGFTTYTEFVYFLITGQNGMVPSPLYRAQMDLSNRREVVSYIINPENTALNCLSSMLKDNAEPLSIELITDADHFAEFNDEDIQISIGSEIEFRMPNFTINFMGRNKYINPSEIIIYLARITQINKKFVKIHSYFYTEDWLLDCFDYINVNNVQIGFYHFINEIFGNEFKLENCVYELDGKIIRKGWDFNCEKGFRNKVIKSYMKIFVKPQISQSDFEKYAIVTQSSLDYNTFTRLQIEKLKSKLKRQLQKKILSDSTITENENANGQENDTEKVEEISVESHDTFESPIEDESPKLIYSAEISTKEVTDHVINVSKKALPTETDNILENTINLTYAHNFLVQEVKETWKSNSADVFTKNVGILDLFPSSTLKAKTKNNASPTMINLSPIMKEKLEASDSGKISNNSLESSEYIVPEIINSSPPIFDNAENSGKTSSVDNVPSPIENEVFNSCDAIDSSETPLDSNNRALFEFAIGLFEVVEDDGNILEKDTCTSIFDYEPVVEIVDLYDSNDASSYIENEQYDEFVKTELFKGKAFCHHQKYNKRIDFTQLFEGPDNKILPFNNHCKVLEDEIFDFNKEYYEFMNNFIEDEDLPVIYGNDYHNEIIETAKKYGNFISLKIIPFELNNFESSEEFKEKIADYLALYHLKYFTFEVDEFEYYKTRYISMQKRSPKHAKFFYEIARDRHLSELYLAFRFFRKDTNDNEDVFDIDAFDKKYDEAIQIYKLDIELHDKEKLAKNKFLCKFGLNQAGSVDDQNLNFGNTTKLLSKINMDIYKMIK